MGEDLDYLNATLETVRNGMIDARERLRSRHTDWQDDDARLTIFNKCSNVVGSAHLGVAFMAHHLCRREWWTEKVKYGDSPHAIQNSCDEFNMFLRISFIQNLFFALESSFRVFVRALDPVACSHGCSEFKSIYEWLLKKLNMQQHAPLLDLIRNVRNVMHNNGLFFPTSAKNASVTYRGQTYPFEVGKPNNFVTWRFILELVPDFTSLAVDIVNSSEFIQITRIPEPS
ncbi:MAG: hypothetical protein IT440_06150 [Phycisphaeraceae bacterium]|nr:hypothetical protein [Phycisphaeraceae bacterium]